MGSCLTELWLAGPHGHMTQVPKIKVGVDICVYTRVYTHVCAHIRSVCVSMSTYRCVHVHAGACGCYMSVCADGHTCVLYVCAHAWCTSYTCRCVPYVCSTHTRASLHMYINTHTSCGFCWPGEHSRMQTPVLTEPLHVSAREPTTCLFSTSLKCHSSREGRWWFLLLPGEEPDGQ